jgi:hypothetical protein
MNLPSIKRAGSTSLHRNPAKNLICSGTYGPQAYHAFYRLPALLSTPNIRVLLSDTFDQAFTHSCHTIRVFNEWVDMIAPFW